MSPPTWEKADLAAIFAGGAGSRMGGVDKGAILLGGQPLHRIVAERLALQANGLAVLASQTPAWLARASDARWLPDVPESKGPAAGLLAALRWLRAEQGDDALLLTAPIDAPFLPTDLFEKLEAARRKAGASAAIVRHAGGLHPVFGLWRAGCAEPVENALATQRALHRIAIAVGAAVCDAWPESSAGVFPDPFTNLNTPEDVAAAETLLRAQKT